MCQEKKSNDKKPLGGKDKAYSYKRSTPHRKAKHGGGKKTEFRVKKTGI